MLRRAAKRLTGPRLTARDAPFPASADIRKGPEAGALAEERRPASLPVYRRFMPETPASAPTLVCVCLPVDDGGFRADVETMLRAAGPVAHLRGDAIVSLVEGLQLRYPGADVAPVVLRAGNDKGARQIWWYVHRDGRPVRIM